MYTLASVYTLAGEEELGRFDRSNSQTACQLRTGSSIAALPLKAEQMPSPTDSAFEKSRTVYFGSVKPSDAGVPDGIKNRISTTVCPAWNGSWYVRHRA